MIKAKLVGNLVTSVIMLPLMIVGLPKGAAHEVVVTGAVPTATAAAMFALKNTADAAATILPSTILGIFTAAALIALFAA